MKTESLQELAKEYNCTLSRAATEILAAAGLEKRHMPAVIRRQRVSSGMIAKAIAYRNRKNKQPIN